MKYLSKKLLAVLLKFKVPSLMVISLSSICLMACSSPKNTTVDKIVVYVDGCQDSEIRSDILNSVRGIENFSKQNNIEVYTNSSSLKCGYSFLSRNKRQNIDEVLTDYGLMQEASLFFLNSKL